MKINELIKDAIEECRSSKVIQAMQTTKITPKQFLFYHRQDALLFGNFEELLTMGIEKAREIGDEELAKAFFDNQNDERGIDEQGNYNPLMSHKLWREKYYSELGISPVIIESEKPTLGTVQYNNTMILLEKAKNIFALVGGFMFLEMFTSIEFYSIKKSRDFIFPEKFVISEQDSPEQRENKLSARIWIDDHIIHDGQKHYTDLLKSVLKYEKNVDAMKEIDKSITLIKEGRLAFDCSILG